MKRYRIVTIVAAASVCAACVNLDDIEGRVSKLEDKVAELDRKCQQFSSNISALDGIAGVLEGAEVITGISEIKENGEVVGYAITFSKSGVKNIYNGKNGKDGKDGKDGDPGEPGAPGAPGDPGDPPSLKSLTATGISAMAKASGPNTARLQAARANPAPPVSPRP